ncbi:hypothetical protein JXR93_02105, partial [bacterium]|nr:hypothetical protein [bacterium]
MNDNIVRELFFTKSECKTEGFLFEEPQDDLREFLEAMKNLNNEFSFKALNNLSKINIFVGTNNSGKSRVLRKIVKNNIIKDIK